MEKFLLYFLFFVSVNCSAQNVFNKVQTSITAGDNTANELYTLDSCYNANYYRDSVLFYKTMVHLKMGAVQSARKALETLQTLSPGFKDINYLHGLIYFSEQNYGKSIESFNLIIEDNPLHLKALYNRSVALGLIGEYASAINDLNRCIEQAPYYSAAYYSRAYWLEFAGKDLESALDYEKVIRMDPKNFDAYFGLANVCSRQKDYTRACDAVQKAIDAGSEVAFDLKGIFCK